MGQALWAFAICVGIVIVIIGVILFTSKDN
jgi:hypothetical protein